MMVRTSFLNLNLLNNFGTEQVQTSSMNFYVLRFEFVGSIVCIDIFFVVALFSSPFLPFLFREDCSSFPFLSDFRVPFVFLLSSSYCMIVLAMTSLSGGKNLI